MNHQNETQPQPGYLPYPPPYPAQMEDEISLVDLWRVLVGKRWLIFLVTAVMTLGAVVHALNAPSIYRAELLMVPAQSAKSGGGGMAALASQFGGLASMAGISLGGGGSSTEMALAILQSRSFAEKYIHDHNLKPLLFHEQWDSEKGEWIIGEPSLLSRMMVFLREQLLPKGPKAEESGDGSPSDWAAYNVVKGMTSVSTDNKTGLVTLAVEWSDPVLAAKWANDAVVRLNAYMREQAVEELQKSIHFLEEQLTQTSLVNAQAILYGLIEEQTKSIMLANVRDEYAFRVIDPAVVPEVRAKPKRKLIVVLGFVLGLMVGVFLAFFRNFLENQKREERESEAEG